MGALVYATSNVLIVVLASFENKFDWPNQEYFYDVFKFQHFDDITTSTDTITGRTYKVKDDVLLNEYKFLFAEQFLVETVLINNSLETYT